MALYVQPTFGLPPTGEPVKLFRNKKFWRGPNHVHTQADPFLYVHRGELFLFNEAMAANGPAWIEGYKTNDLVRFAPLGVVLKEQGHLSYPFVFKARSGIFMIPESLYSREVRLYRFNRFPKDLRMVRTLLAGDYVDTSAIEIDGTWFVFTTSLSGGLQLFLTDDIVSGPLSIHPSSPVTVDPRFARCGGVPVKVGRKLYRLAQNCAETYGRNLNVMEIKEISRTEYNESPVKENIFGLDKSWNSLGSHHVSLASFKGQTIIAIDGQEPDHFVIHKAVQGLHRLVASRLG
jgi:hypothetical protein